MKQDKETKNKLLASARTEFREKGYANASLRNICRNAGVTTGALYFFFKDKADLYDSLVKDIVGTIFAVMHGHFAGESEQVEAGALGHLDEVDTLRHFEDTEKVIHLMYEHRDDVRMLLTKSQGSSYEGVLDSFIETAEKHNKAMARQMERANPGKRIDDGLIHWLTHQQIEAFVYMITHIEDERQAMVFMKQSIAFMLAGWYGLFNG